MLELPLRREIDTTQNNRECAVQVLGKRKPEGGGLHNIYPLRPLQMYTAN